jgi:pimeloyl-ACP methyl ester carboxylesterase
MNMINPGPSTGLEGTQTSTSAGCFFRMPFVSIDPDLRLFYNIYSPRGDQIDPLRQTILLLHPRLFDHEFMEPQYTDNRLKSQYNLVGTYSEASRPPNLIPLDCGRPPLPWQKPTTDRQYDTLRLRPGMLPHTCGFIHSSITAEQNAHDLFGLMDKFGITAFHIFGVALGSLLGIRMAVLQPTRVLTLTLCTTLSSRRR